MSKRTSGQPPKAQVVALIEAYGRALGAAKTRATAMEYIGRASERAADVWRKE